MAFISKFSTDNTQKKAPSVAQKEEFSFDMFPKELMALKGVLSSQNTLTCEALPLCLAVSHTNSACQDNNPHENILFAE